jgi:biopolymer transport protein TolR
VAAQHAKVTKANNMMAFGSVQRTTHAPPMSDINMTPLIDADALVLLVIFIITAPLLASSIRS